LNRRPHDYESCALTSWATSPFHLEVFSSRLRMQR